jgi:pilus assembly protein CpaB
MRRGRILIFLAVILIVGLILVAVALPKVLPMLQGTPATPATVDVYIVTQNIPLGETIIEAYLGTRPLPPEYVTEEMFTTAEKDMLINKVAKYPLTPGAFITTAMVSDGTPEAGGPLWASLIPPGMNAVAVPIARLTSVAYGIQDGAHVNVTACMQLVDVDPSFQTTLPNQVATVTGPSGDAGKMPGISLGVNAVTADGGLPPQGRTEVEPAFQQAIYVLPSESQRPRLVCQMILQNVKVLKLGNFDVNATATTAQPTPEGQQAAAAATPPDIATLIVSPQDAVTLTYMIYSNIPLNLTLRRADDDLRQATEAATLQFLLSQYNIPVPVKLAYGITPRIDILALPFLPGDVVTVPPQ